MFSRAEAQDERALANNVAGWARLLDSSTVVSVNRAVELLNQGAIACPESICVVFSASSQAYFLLYRAGFRELAMTNLARMEEGRGSPVKPGATTPIASTRASTPKRSCDFRTVPPSSVLFSAGKPFLKSPTSPVTPVTPLAHKLSHMATTPPALTSPIPLSNMPSESQPAADDADPATGEPPKTPISVPVEVIISSSSAKKATPTPGIPLASPLSSSSQNHACTSPGLGAPEKTFPAFPAAPLSLQAPTQPQAPQQQQQPQSQLQQQQQQQHQPHQQQHLQQQQSQLVYQQQHDNRARTPPSISERTRRGGNLSRRTSLSDNVNSNAMAPASALGTPSTSMASATSPVSQGSPVVPPQQPPEAAAAVAAAAAAAAAASTATAVSASAPVSAATSHSVRRTVPVPLRLPAADASSSDLGTSRPTTPGTNTAKTPKTPIRPPLVKSYATLNSNCTANCEEQINRTLESEQTPTATAAAAVMAATKQDGGAGGATSEIAPTRRSIERGGRSESRRGSGDQLSASLRQERTSERSQRSEPLRRLQAPGSPQRMAEGGEDVDVGGRTFRLIKIIGRGAFGVVWQARELVADTEPVAIKSVGAKTSKAFAAAVFEAELLRLLAPRLPPTCRERVPRYISHGSFRDGAGGGSVRLAMTFVRGDALDQWLYGISDEEHKRVDATQLVYGSLPGGRQHTLKLAAACSLARDLVTQLAGVFNVLQAIAFHRDLSSHNVLVECNEEVLVGAERIPKANFALIDFGLAVRSGSWHRDWSTSNLAGDPRYWTPPAWMALAFGFRYIETHPNRGFHRQYLSRLDHFSLGVLGLELLFALWDCDSEDAERYPTMLKAREHWCSFWLASVKLFQMFHNQGSHEVRQYIAWSPDHGLATVTNSLKQLRAALRSAASDPSNASRAGLLAVLADLIDERGTASWATLGAAAAEEPREKNHGSWRMPASRFADERGPPATSSASLGVPATAAAAAAAAVVVAAAAGNQHYRRARSIDKVEEEDSPRKGGCQHGNPRSVSLVNDPHPSIARHEGSPQAAREVQAYGSRERAQSFNSFHLPSRQSTSTTPAERQAVATVMPYTPPAWLAPQGTRSHSYIPPPPQNRSWVPAPVMPPSTPGAAAPKTQAAPVVAATVSLPPGAAAAAGAGAAAAAAVAAAAGGLPPTAMVTGTPEHISVA